MPFYSSATNCTTTTATTSMFYYVQTTAATSACLATNYYQNARNELILSDRERQAALVARHAPEAQKRANELLLANLTPEQRQTFEEKKWFIVEGGKSRKRYRIRSIPHMVANIDVLGDGESISHKLCGHCDVREVPLADHLLAQKLMLEIAEDDFLCIANRHAA